MNSYLVDPTDIIDYSRSIPQLELFWLFTACVAGKQAKRQAIALERFLLSLPGTSPFEKIRNAEHAENLAEKLRESRLGQYGRLEVLFRQSLSLDLQRCSVGDLEAIHGVGPKTARMFLMFTRPNQRFAALDTHLLKYLREQGHVAPKATPTGRTYRRLEEIFLGIVDRSGMTVAEFDLMIWKKYAKASTP